MQQNNLKTKYEKEVKPELKKTLSVNNDFALPRVRKVVVNMGTGDTSKSKETFNKVIEDMTAITGQKPKITQAKKSIAGFNVREGQQVGLSVTLRGDRMYSFLTKLITVTLPRLRDFRGVPQKGFDNNGNYTLGFTEHTVFPEIDFAKVDRPRGLEVTIVSNAGSKEKGKLLLDLLGMPFEKE